MKKTRPNVLLITADSLRADHLGCYGYKKPTSPNIDAFAQESCFFSHAFSNGPNTPHAFPAIMASRYPLMSSKLGLFDAPVTLAEVLQSQGYTTAGFNAGNPYVSKYFQYDRGFDEFFDYLDFEIAIEAQNVASEKVKKTKATSTSKDNRRFSSVAVPKLDLERYLVTEDSMKRKAWIENEINQALFGWLKENATSPFFIWVHYMDTHYPYVPQKRFQHEMAVQPFSQRETFYTNICIRENQTLSPRALQRTIDLYDAAIRQLDTKTGELIRFLKQQELYESTLLIFSADHGEEFQEHGDLQHKSKLFDELIRVPLLMKLPDSNMPVIFSEIVGLIDLAPTVLAQLQLDNPFERTSFLGKNSSGLSYVIAEASYGSSGATPVDEQMLNIDPLPKIYCYRSKQWKMVLDQGKNQTYLYNLLMDPNETRDVSDIYRSQANQLLRYLEEHSKFIEKKRLFSKIKKVQKKLDLAISK
ncbi:MAG: sulfatase [bacterium]